MQDEDDVIIEPGGDEEVGASEEELDASESRAESKLAKLRKELEQARKEKQENQDGWQRAKADYVNALRRFEEEKKAERNLGLSIAVNALLPGLDALNRAESAGKITEEMRGIYKLVQAAFAGLNVYPVAATIGMKFDPNMHEALGQDPAESQGQDDTITAVLEPGWKIGEQVIRPAKVRVAHFEG